MVKKLIIDFLIQNGTRLGKSMFKAYAEVIKKQGGAAAAGAAGGGRK